MLDAEVQKELRVAIESSIRKAIRASIKESTKKTSSPSLDNAWQGLSNQYRTALDKVLSDINEEIFVSGLKNYSGYIVNVPEGNDYEGRN